MVVFLIAEHCVCIATKPALSFSVLLVNADISNILDITDVSSFSCCFYAMAFYSIFCSAASSALNFITLSWIVVIASWDA